MRLQDVHQRHVATEEQRSRGEPRWRLRVVEMKGRQTSNMSTNFVEEGHRSVIFAQRDWLLPCVWLYSKDR